MDEPSPRMTAPIDSSSRFSARPTVPSSNSSSSFTASSGRPDTPAMPSPTSRMRPTCESDTSGLKPSRFFFNAAVMSAVLIVSSAMVPLERVAHLVEAGLDGTVDDGVADGGDESAEHGRVDHDLHLDVLAGGLLDGARQ